jgi:hypothetical protein
MTSLACCEMIRGAAIYVLLVLAFSCGAAIAQTRDLGGGFQDHGPFARATTSRGIVCTVDGEGRNVILVWLFDHRYSYALAVIDAATGDVELVPRPISRDAPFASILGSNGRYYTYMGSHFIEFDPLKREFTFVEEGPSRVAMSMTEDDNGTIWAGIYPDGDVVSYNPQTGEYRVWGPLGQHPSLRYPRTIAADDQGWIYMAIGHAEGQVFILDPGTGQVSTLIPEDLTRANQGVGVRRHLDGKVYAWAPFGDEGRRWFELHGGQVTMLDEAPRYNPKPIIADTQGLFHRDLPNGEKVQELDLIEGRLVVENPETGTLRELSFEIEGEGGAAMGVGLAPDNTIVGGTYIPSWFFNYDPSTDKWTREDCYGQWNVTTSAGGRLYVASYTEGVLLEWDPAKEWVPTEKTNPDSNPRYLEQTFAYPEVGRPYTILAYPDERHIIYGGTGGYGYTGSGLAIYDTETEMSQVISHHDLVPWQCTTSLAPLPNNRLLVGTQVGPAMGGVQKADVAELYIFDMASRKLEWHAPMIQDATRYSELLAWPNGMVFGFAGRNILFAFDPDKREIVYQEDMEPRFGLTAWDQGPRIFVPTDDGRIFILFNRGIAELDPESYTVTMRAEVPRGIANGGVYLDGRIYYSTGTHLHSWEVPIAQ